MKRLKIILTSLVLLLQISAAQADTVIDAIKPIQTQWAVINYQTPHEQKLKAFERLIAEAENVVTQYPNDAEAYTWLGIVQSTTAGAKGGLGALSYAKAAKASFEKSIAISEQALDGSALTSLGLLYHKVPGFPIGFGNDKKAKNLLEKGLQYNAHGIDSNYFYAEFLYDRKDYHLAEKYLNIASNAPARNRPIADEGRVAEVSQLRQKILDKL